MVEPPIVFKTIGRAGFTLIELSIVMVIIGLIIGGIVVGRDLINVAAIRSQISQIEKYQTAMNTFRGKYGYLPGDIPTDVASQYGFAIQSAGLPAMNGTIGQGDGNGIVEGIWYGISENGGETIMFWTHLSQAGLIEGGFTTVGTPANGAVALSALPQYFPLAKIGQGNFVYVYATGRWNGAYWDTTTPGVYDSSSVNWFGISAITTVNTGGWPASSPAMSVQQAYSIDTKIDDGNPFTGRVKARYLGAAAIRWMDGTGWNNADTGATVGSSTTCYDNNGIVGIPSYSMEQNGGAGLNCSLAIRFQ
jgi:prepilin-type N-terminal cleavage/methylation domain-containing protein